MKGLVSESSLQWVSNLQPCDPTLVVLSIWLSDTLYNWTSDGHWSVN